MCSVSQHWNVSRADTFPFWLMFMLLLAAAVVPATSQLWQDEAPSSRYARFLFLSGANTEILHKADCAGQEVGI